jgi:hypothetical protein
MTDSPHPDQTPGRLVGSHRAAVEMAFFTLIPIAFFIPTLVAIGLGAPEWVNSPFGILFHLSLLPVVSRLPVPDFARAAGYGWLTLDTACGVMLYYGVAFDVAWPIRLAGHLFAAIWLISASVTTRHWSIRIVGVLTALWLASYTFFFFALPESYLGPPGVLTCVWLALVAWRYGDGSQWAV